MYNSMRFEWDAAKNRSNQKKVREAVLLVVHVYREENPNGEEIIRIISAREADPRERRVYLEQAPY
jgi:uncharacterized DUF497 family protein